MSSSVPSIAHWQGQVADLLPSLSKPQAQVLGMLSYAIILTGGCGLTRLSTWLAQVEQVPAGRLRQRLREFYYEVEAKRGSKRQEVEVEGCFADLLAGILKNWSGSKELALALDASALGERFTVLSISVVYRGCGMPVAWTILPANQPGEWREHWERMLRRLGGVVPKEWKVLMMADRGLYASWLYREVQALGWHPFFRVKENLRFRGEDEHEFRPMGQRVNRHGRGWSGAGEWSEQGERMTGTLLVRWEKGYEEKLAVVTDLPPAQAQVAWYQMRFWIEDEYKDHKRGGFRWEQTKMTDPGRAKRLWLAMAVAMQVAVLLGGKLEDEEQRQARKGGQQGRRRGSRKKPVGRPPKPIRRPRAREQSCLVRGQQAISAAAMRGEEVPVGHVVAEAWPKHTYAVGKPASSWVRKRKHKEERKRQRKSKQTQEKRRTREQQRQHERETRRWEQAQQRAQRPRGHEEIARHRQRRLTRKQERAERRAQVALASPRPASSLFVAQEPLAPLPQPP